MNTLREKILQQCRDEVAVKNGYPNWDWLMTSCEEIPIPKTIESFNTAAALLAMEKLVNFYKWASLDWVWMRRDQVWANGRKRLTEEQLYEEYGRAKQ